MYIQRDTNSATRPESHYHDTASAQIFPLLVVSLAGLLLFLSGMLYRVIASHLAVVTDTPIKLAIPLSNMPFQIGSWIGTDVSIPANIQQVAGNDAFLSRLYVNQSTHQWANVYVAYSARPRSMLGHRPQICYPGSGWIHDNTQSIRILSDLGMEAECLLHRFHKLTPAYDEIVVLNYYIVNGQITNDESVFSGLNWRTPNIAGNPARYVAQVQISSALENSVLIVAKNVMGLILNCVPSDTDNSKTMAAELKNQAGNF